MLGKIRELLRVTASVVDNPSVANHRLHALARAIHWQLSKRTGAWRAIVSVGPAKIYCYPESTGGSSVLYAGLYDWDEMLFMLRYLDPGDHMIDVGANIGAYSIFAAKLIPGVRISTVEPDSLARERLRENLNLNGVAAAIISEKVLGDHEGEVTFSSGRDTLNSIVEASDTDAITLPMTTLDALVERAPALVKIDVEGAELEVLKGGSATLSAERPPALIFELNGLCERFGASPKSIREFLAQFNYGMFEYSGASNELTPFERDGYPAGKNVIALKSRAAAIERLAASAAELDITDLPIKVKIQRNV